MRQEEQIWKYCTRRQETSQDVIKRDKEKTWDREEVQEETEKRRADDLSFQK